MATYLNGKRPRRITKIRVDEISEVDRPANGVPFLLYKREDGAPDAAPSCSIPELAEYAPRRAGVSKSAPTEYDGAAIRGLLGDLAKAGDAPGDGTRITPDDVPPDLTAEDYRRQRERIDASGVATANSPRLYPPVHVPSAVDRTNPVTV